MSHLMMDQSSALVLAPSPTVLGGVREDLRRTERLETSNVLLVVYGHGPETVRDIWRDRIDETPARLGVIGVGAANDEDDSEPVSADGADVLTSVRNPDDVSDLGMTISLYLEDWATAETRTVLGFHSLTAMLGHVDLETVFKFLHVLTRRLDAIETSGRFYLDPVSVDEQTIETLRPVFDTVIERGRPEEADPITPDVAFDLVRASRRRYVLYHLLESAEGVTVEGLATSVAAREDDADPDRIETSLRHSHLPKLEDAGLISLDSDRVVPRRSIEAIEPYLSPATSHDLPEDESST